MQAAFDVEVCGDNDGPHHLLATEPASRALLRQQTWLLGPSAAGDGGAVPRLLRQLEIPEEQQRIFGQHSGC